MEGASDDDAAGGGGDCTICSEQLRVPGSSVTRCGHVFHTACLNQWLDVRRVCPLCKAPTATTRVLRGPTPIGSEEEARMRALVASAPPNHGPEAIILGVRGAVSLSHRLEPHPHSGCWRRATHPPIDVRCSRPPARPPRPQLERRVAQHAHDAAVATEARSLERERLGQKRAAVHRLEADLLKLRRELAAAQRMEEKAVSAAAARGEGDAALASAGGEGGHPTDGSSAAPPPLLPPGRSISREAVAQQSRQLAWRCQELRELEDKIKTRQRQRSAY